MPRLALASGNPHKLEELRRALPRFEIELLGRDDPPPEDGATYEDNARIKARWGRAHAPEDAWAVGEDSGIEAVALGGAPGVRTARWAAGDPVGRMLEALTGEDERAARYVCVMVAIAADGRELVAEGMLEGSSRARPPATRGSASIRCSSPRARRGRSPRSATPGSASTRTAPARRRRSRFS